MRTFATVCNLLNLVTLCGCSNSIDLRAKRSATKATAQTSATFSVPTATSAKPQASAPTIEGATAYIEYSVVEGFFLQDLPSTDPTTFDYVCTYSFIVSNGHRYHFTNSQDQTATNFGLINQTYKTGRKQNPKLTQWERFNRLLFARNQEASPNIVYKLLFIGRHGEGFHNAAESYYGTPAWNVSLYRSPLLSQSMLTDFVKCYYAELEGNSSVTWADAHLTPNGVAQALRANKFWAQELMLQNIEPPQSYYVSPLTRCLQTAQYTYSNLSLPSYYPFVPLVKEFFREGVSIHTCDHRSNRTQIRNTFPNYRIDPDFTEEDELWNGITAETSSAQDYRSKLVLDQLFSSDPSAVVSITTHSGEAASLLRVLGHIPFPLTTGEIIPVFVKAKTMKGRPTRTSTVPWTQSSWCTNGPPKSSMTTAPYQCVCKHGVAPVATTASSTSSS